MSATQVKFSDFIAAIATEETQEIENAFFTLFNLMDIDNIEGAPLIKIADKVGLKTQPTDTDTLRDYIKGQIAINTSKGQFQDMYAVFSNFLGSDDAVIEEQFPMQLLLKTNETVTAATAQIIVDYMQIAAASGVLVQGIVPHPAPHSGYFIYDSAFHNDTYDNGVYIDYIAVSELLK
jgi:hypothetical protein